MTKPQYRVEKVCVICTASYRSSKYNNSKTCSRKCRGDWIANQVTPGCGTERSKKRFEKKIRERAIEALGGKCASCGFADARALQIDHVHGGGGADRKSFSGPTAYHKYVFTEASTGKYQILCANCNWIKRIENKENGASYIKMVAAIAPVLYPPKPPISKEEEGWTRDRRFKTTSRT